MENTKKELEQLISDDIKISSIGIEFKRDLPIERWIKIGDALRKISGAVQFWIGDWINYGEATYGERYSQALEATDYDYQTLRNFAWTARNVQLSVRTDKLPFSFHEKVAKLPPEKQKAALAKAEHEGYNRQQFARFLKGKVPQPDGCDHACSFGHRPLMKKEEQPEKLSQPKAAKAPRPEVDEVINAMLSHFHLTKLDKSVASNRRYAYLAVQKYGLSDVLKAIGNAAQDSFWKTRITSTDQIYYKVGQFANTKKPTVWHI